MQPPAGFTLAYDSGVSRLRAPAGLVGEGGHAFSLPQDFATSFLYWGTAANDWRSPAYFAPPRKPIFANGWGPCIDGRRTGASETLRFSRLGPPTGFNVAQGVFDWSQRYESTPFAGAIFDATFTALQPGSAAVIEFSAVLALNQPPHKSIFEPTPNGFHNTYINACTFTVHCEYVSGGTWISGQMLGVLDQERGDPGSIQYPRFMQDFYAYASGLPQRPTAIRVNNTGLGIYNVEIATDTTTGTPPPAPFATPFGSMPIIAGPSSYSIYSPIVQMVNARIEGPYGMLSPNVTGGVRLQMWAPPQPRKFWTGRFGATEVS